MVAGLNEVDGIAGDATEGSMYAFPSVKLPRKAFDAAKAKVISADTLYSFPLRNQTGIYVVPASGFGEKKNGPVGFRTTFLPPDHKMMKAIDEFAR